MSMALCGNVYHYGVDSSRPGFDTGSAHREAARDPTTQDIYFSTLGYPG